MRYSTHVRCACTRLDGKPAGQACPQLWRADGGWNSRHGSAGFACRIPTSDGTRLVKRFGYRSKADAQRAADQVTGLFELTGDTGTRARIGDMVAAAKRGALPTMDDVRRQLGHRLDSGQPGTIDPTGYYVYLLWATQGDDRPLYVGCSANILARLGAHLGNAAKRTHIGWVTYYRCPSEQLMLRREGQLIRKYLPPWNRRIPPEQQEAVESTP